jgi:DNA repair exonuclease SbcCD nuclease subunit
MKIAHLTDLHITLLPPRLSGLLDRRVSGSMNLRLGGRGDRYRAAPKQGAHAVAQIMAEKPDAVVFGGDATSLSEPEEFDGAAAVLRPLLDLGVPCFALPGNHDRYTRLAEREQRFERAFEGWQVIGSGWQHVQLQEHHISFVDTAQANRWIWDSRGRTVEIPKRAPRLVFAHYALLDHRAQPDRKWHALRNETLLRHMLRDGPGTTWCCGHLHRSFSARAGGLVQYCAGSVGGPKGAWQMITIGEAGIQRQAWTASGPGKTSQLR